MPPPDLKSDTVHLIYRIDIGFSENRGYSALVVEVNPDGKHRQKGIKGNSAEQLMSRLRRVLIEEMEKRKRFPLESEGSKNGSPTIITPDSEDPLFRMT